MQRADCNSFRLLPEGRTRVHGTDRYPRCSLRPASTGVALSCARMCSMKINATGGLEMFENQNADDIKSMIERNDEFKRLYQRHRDLDKQVDDAELGVRPMDDMTLHTLKKEKLIAKDRLTFLWEHRA
jgi:uncharacterized protein YdcH (DUF465 family)